VSGYIIQPAVPEDNEELCSLCKIPAKGHIMLAFERSPDFFAGSGIQSEEVEVYTCKRKVDHKIVGVFSVGSRRIFFKGDIKQTRYISDLRVYPDEQGSGLVYQLTRFIADNVLGEDAAQTIIFADNDLMLNLIERLTFVSKKRPVFRFFPAGNYTSYMVKFATQTKIKDSAYLVRKAEDFDIPKMQKLLLYEGPKKQFFPYYDFNILNTNYHKGLAIDNFYLAFENEKLVGITGIWDQHSIKQTRVCNYSLVYKLIRPFVNFYGSLFNGFMLPAKGTVLRYLAMHSIVIRGNNSLVFNSILQQINNDHSKKQFDYFLVGLDERDNLNEALKKFPNKRIIKGKHFLISKKDVVDEAALQSIFYLEAARI
jgi:hypothetical protein